MLKSLFHSAGVALFAVGSAAALAVSAASPAVAETQVGWTGGTTNQSGHFYGHSSTISNDTGRVIASTDIWNAWGSTVPPYWMAAQARLFKSGVLCESTGYTSNSTATNNLHVQTSGTGCGAGSYNSHGLVKTFNGSGDTEWVTFPTNPINQP
jgi:hypothetical protein